MEESDISCSCLGLDSEVRECILVDLLLLHSNGICFLRHTALWFSKVHHLSSRSSCRTVRQLADDRTILSRSISMLATILFATPGNASPSLRMRSVTVCTISWRS